MCKQTRISSELWQLLFEIEPMSILSRDQEDTAGLFKRLQFADVEIFTLADGYTTLTGKPWVTKHD